MAALVVGAWLRLVWLDVLALWCGEKGEVPWDLGRHVCIAFLPSMANGLCSVQHLVLLDSLLRPGQHEMLLFSGKSG